MVHVSLSDMFQVRCCRLRSKGVSYKGVRDWSLIMGGGGLQNGKITGPKLFAPPHDKVKLFAPSPFKEWKLVVPPPSIWLKLQATA